MSEKIFFLLSHEEMEERRGKKLFYLDCFSCNCKLLPREREREREKRVGRERESKPYSILFP